MSNKVIFIGPAYPYKGGIAAFNESMATTFQENGWDCKIYTFSEQYAFTSKDKLTTEDPRPNLTIKRGIYSINPLNWLKISKEIVKEQPKLIVTQYWMPYLAPAFGTIFRGVKKELPDVSIATIVHSFKPHQSKIGDKQLNKFLTNRTDTLVCLSEGVQEEILNSGTQQPVSRLFHPIYEHYGSPLPSSMAKEKLGWSKEKKHFLFFGEVKNYKGLDLLLSALPTEDKYRQNYKLHISGEFIESHKTGYNISKHLQKSYIYKKNDGRPQVIDTDSDIQVKTLVSTYHKIQRLTGTFVRDGETGLRLLSENECKAIMGFPKDFKIPVSRTQMYRQFGNSVAIPVVEAIAGEMLETLKQTSNIDTPKSFSSISAMAN